MKRNGFPAGIILAVVAAAAVPAPVLHADQAEADKVRAAAEACYEAFSARDIGQTEQCWWHDPYVRMTHPPDKAPRGGWEAVRRSWEDVFARFEKISIRMENPQIRVADRVAWISTRELLQGRLKDGTEVTVPTLATRVLEKRGDTWRTVLHHASFEPK